MSEYNLQKRIALKHMFEYNLQKRIALRHMSEHNPQKRIVLRHIFEHNLQKKLHLNTYAGIIRRRGFLPNICRDVININQHFHKRRIFYKFKYNEAMAI